MSKRRSVSGRARSPPNAWLAKATRPDRCSLRIPIALGLLSRPGREDLLGEKYQVGIIPPTKTEDALINRGIETDPENPEWTHENFARARHAKDVLPPDLYQAAIKRYRGQRGPQKTPVKQDIKLRIDRDIIAIFKATGRGWHRG